MPSHFTLVRISKLIQTTADAELQAEMLRQVLCEKPAFETFSAFKRISKFHSKVTTQNLYAFLKENSADINKDDAYSLMRLFDTDKDGRISFTEFLDIVLPKTNALLKDRVNSRKSHDHEQDEGLPYQIEHALIRIFEEELQFFKKCQSIRQELGIARDFSVMAAFSEIDVRNRGYVDAEDISQFFDKINKDLPEHQLTSFMQRVDKDGDGRITFNDFLEVFYTKEVDLLKDSKNSNSNSNSKTASVAKYAERTPTLEKSASDKYLDELRDRYASPSRRNMSPTKKLMLGSNEGFFSPGSTNASSKNNNVEPEAQVEQVKETTTGHRVRFASEVETPEKKTERRRSPMKVKDEVELVKAFEGIVRYMHGLEELKNEMAARKDFNLYNAFAVFDMDRKGSVDKKQLAKGLTKLGLELSQGDMFLIMKTFDSASSGVIRFGDFSCMATPRSAEYAKILNTKLAYYATNQGDPLKIFSKETVSAMRMFWTALVKGELLFETLRQKLGESRTFSLQGAFKTLDTKDDGYITANQLERFLGGYGVKVTKDDLNSLVERLTVRDDKKVSYMDFVNTMTPKSPEKYPRREY